PAVAFTFTDYSSLLGCENQFVHINSLINCLLIDLKIIHLSETKPVAYRDGQLLIIYQLLRTYARLMHSTITQPTLTRLRCLWNQSRASWAACSSVPDSSNRWEAPGTSTNCFSVSGGISASASLFNRMTVLS